MVLDHRLRRKLRWRSCRNIADGFDAFLSDQCCIKEKELTSAPEMNKLPRQKSHSGDRKVERVTGKLALGLGLGICPVSRVVFNAFISALFICRLAALAIFSRTSSDIFPSPLMSSKVFRFSRRSRFSFFFQSTHSLPFGAVSDIAKAISTRPIFPSFPRSATSNPLSTPVSRALSAAAAALSFSGFSGFGGGRRRYDLRGRCVLGRRWKRLH